MKLSSNNLNVFFNPIHIVASMNTKSSTTVPSKYICEMVRKSCLKAFLKSILLMYDVVTHGTIDSLNPTSFVLY